MATYFEMLVGRKGVVTFSLVGHFRNFDLMEGGSAWYNASLASPGTSGGEANA